MGPRGSSARVREGFAPITDRQKKNVRVREGRVIVLGRPMLRAFHVTPALLALALSSCGGQVVFYEGGGGSGGSGSATQSSATHGSSTGKASSGTGAFSCTAVSFDFAAPMGVCTSVDHCDIVGTLADGRGLRESCKSDGKNAACALFVDDVQVCSCPSEAIDWARLCANGVPTCSGWLVDYGDISFCPTK